MNILATITTLLLAATGNPDGSNTVPAESPPVASPDAATTPPSDLPDGASLTDPLSAPPNVSTERPAAVVVPWPEEPAPVSTTQIVVVPSAHRTFQPVTAPVDAAAPRYPALNWFGLGLRYGTQYWNLRASSIHGRWIGPSSTSGAKLVVTDLKDSLRVWTPTLHLGGNDYFFKMEFPMGISDRLKTFGFGLYPVNFGRFITRARLFPYGSVGGVASFAIVRPEINGHRGAGALLQGRAAVGMKWRPLTMISLSVEVGYAHWALGLVAEEGNKGDPGSVLGVPPPTGRGGSGRTWDFSFGVEVL